MVVSPNQITPPEQSYNSPKQRVRFPLETIYHSLAKIAVIKGFSFAKRKAGEPARRADGTAKEGFRPSSSDEAVHIVPA